MNTQGIAKLAATSILLSVSLSGCGLFSKGVASSSEAMPSRGEGGDHASMSKDLAKLIAKRKGDKAVKLGENLVEASPQNAGYRMQLGEAYLLAGRFNSAETAFGDALDLTPGDERAALKLALVKSALGKQEQAKSILEDHRGSLSASDYGLALALAGDAKAAVSSLESAVRGPKADARTRQNLALAHALAGNWTEARVIASQDLSAEDVDGRMTQWAQFATPRSSWDQVASLLGVQPVDDKGQPMRLALNAARRPANQVAYAPKPLADQPSAHFEISSAAPSVARDVAPVFELSSMDQAAPDRAAPVAAPQPRASEAPMIMASNKPAKRKMIVEYTGGAKPKAQPSAVAKAPVKSGLKSVQTAMAPAKKPVQMASSAPVSMGGGRFVVQLGAYGSVKAADQAWASTKSKVSALGSYKPVKTSVQSGGSTLQRLTVSGLASKSAADTLCASIKASGSSCFVRAGSEGAPVQMAAKKSAVKVAAKVQAKPVVKVASR